MSCELHHQRGAGLIEVLIAVLVLSLGLLGALKLQTEGVRQNADSRYTVLAAALAHDALDAITYDRFGDKSDWLGIDSIGTPHTCSSEADSSSASASASADGDRADSWRDKVACDLPGGKAKLSCADSATAGARTCKVELRWTPPGRDTVTASYEMYAGAAASSAASSSGG